MSRRVLPQVQEVGFLRGVHGVTLRDNVHSSEIRGTLNLEPLFRIELATATGKLSRGRPSTRWCDYISDLQGCCKKKNNPKIPPVFFKPT